MSTNQSRCMYCGSTSYGSGCIFSSHKIHIHVDDPTRCIYCGMMAYGSGCIFNPFTKMHIHGMDVGQTLKETVRKTVELSYITDRLLKDIKSTEAYSKGLLDEKGKLLRAPTDLYEQRLISPLSRLLFKLKNYIPIEANILVESLQLFTRTDETPEEYQRKLQLEQEIFHVINQLKTIIENNIHQLSLETIEEAIESALLNSIIK